MSSLYDERAWLYDAAFSWDVEDEVAWLLGRLGPAVTSVLEPGCGSGRLFPALARRGVRIAGIDRSESMLARARDRMAAAGLPEPRLVVADMADFELGEMYDGAACPINTFSYLATTDDALAHLRCMARHLLRGARYLVQLDIRRDDELRVIEADAHSRWEVDTPHGRIACTFGGRDFDASRLIETQVSRFEVLSGPDAGTVLEDTHEMRCWTWHGWRDLVAASPFRQVAAHDGSTTARRPLAVGSDLSGRRLTWHELEVA